MTEVTGLDPAPTVSEWAPSVRAPAFWQALHYLSNPVGFFCEAHARYGDAFTIRVLGERWVVLAHAKLVKEAFAQGPFEVNSGEPNQVLRPVIGTRNLLLMDGAEHLHRRRMVLPAFHGERIAGYEHMIRDAIRTEISRWPLRAPVAVLPRMDALVLRIVLRCVLGAEQTDRFTRLASRLQQILAWITDRRRLLVYFLLGPEQLMRLPAFARQVRALDREVFALIAQRRVADDLKRREDILSLLIQAQDEEGTGLSDGELRDELVTLLVAGHQNTAALLSWAIHELARDPESQESLATQPERVASAIITETLRLRPPVPLMVRRARRELLIDGHRIPAGTNLGPCALLVQRRADHYVDPLTFRPQRFLSQRPIASEWFPFGGSVRRCVGAAFAQFEAKLVLTEIAKMFRLIPEDHRPEKTSPRAIVLVPANDARVALIRRR